MMLASTPLLVSIINSILAGAIVSLLAIQLGVDPGPALLIGTAGFVASLAGWIWYARREIGGVQSKRDTPLFPPRDGQASPIGGDSGAPGE
jgi:hypothetical protein